MGYLNIGRCGDCMTPIVIMDTQTGQILPVEVEPGKSYEDTEVFNYKIHKSHLLKCEAMRLRWNDFKIKFFKRRAAQLKLEQKDLLR